MLTYPQLLSIAQQCGIDAIGYAPARRLDEEAVWMDQWLAEGLHGNMDYLERNRDKRYDIRQLVSGAQTVVVALVSYDHSGHDYHRAVKSKLYELEQQVRRYLASQGHDLQVSEGQHIFCDSAPVLERRWAVEAGLGWIGKNHQLIHPQLGSWVHIGEWVINEVWEDYDRIVTHEMTLPGGQCGDCQLCVHTCPHHALQPLWDARQCQAYITHKCTICQQVCPKNGAKS